MIIRPPSFDRLVRALAQFPTIGPKTATRIALWLLKRPPETGDGIAEAIREARRAVRRCIACHQFSESETCPICSDAARDHGVICVVEDPVEVWSFERTGQYRGLYHVLGGALSPLDSIGPDDLTISSLIDRVATGKGAVREIIMATDPDTEGNATAHYIAALLVPYTVKITRLAHGIPVGGELAYSDEATLAEALRGRRSMDEHP